MKIKSISKAVLLFALLTSTSFVHVSISNEGADTYLFGPGIDDSVDLSRYSPELDSHGQYSLPASGKYELRVLQTRNDARKNKTKKYNVDIQIK